MSDTQRQEVVTEELAEERAFEAGFNATDVEPIASTGDEAATTEIQPAEQPEGGKGDSQPKRSLSDDDLAAVMQKVNGEFGKNFDRVFGKLGEFNQKLTELQNVREKAAGISPKARERLKEEFPELEALLFDEVEEAEINDLQQKEIQPQPEPQLEQQPDNQLTADQVVERRLLKRDHPDWEQTVVSPEFIAWTEQLPAADKEKLRTSWDADYVSTKLTEYKTLKEAALNKKTEGDKNKKARLEAAVVPRGTPSDTSSDADDEEAAMVKAFRPRR